MQNINNKKEIGFFTVFICIVSIFVLCHSVFAAEDYKISIQPQEGASENVYSICRVADESGATLYTENFDWDTVKAYYEIDKMSNTQVMEFLKSKLSPATLEASDIGLMARCVKSTIKTVKNDTVPVSVPDGSFVLVSETSSPLICGVGMELGTSQITVAEKNDIPINEPTIKDLTEVYVYSAFLASDKIGFFKSISKIPVTYYQFFNYPFKFIVPIDNTLIFQDGTVKVIVDENTDITEFANIELTGGKLIVGFDNLRDTSKEPLTKIKDGSLIELNFNCLADISAGTGIDSPCVYSKVTYPLSPTSDKTADTVEHKSQAGLLKMQLYALNKGDQKGLEAIDYTVENSDGMFLTDKGTFENKENAKTFSSDSSGLVVFNCPLGCGNYKIHQMNNPENFVPSSNQTDIDLSASFVGKDMLMDSGGESSDITIDAKAKGAGVVSDVDAKSGLVSVKIEHSDVNKPFPENIIDYVANKVFPAITQTFDNKVWVVLGIILIGVCAALIYVYSRRQKERIVK